MKRIATDTVNICGAIIKKGQEFYITEIKGSAYGSPADPAYRVQHGKSRATMVATACLSFIESFSVEAEPQPAKVTGCTVTARRNTRHGQTVPMHEFETIGVRLCVLHGIRRRRRLWVMDGGENGKIYVKVGANEFRVEHEIEVED